MNPKTLIAPLVIAAALVSSPAAAQGARLRLDQLNRLAQQAGETVDISVDPAMLKQAVSFLASQDADEAKLQAVVDGLTGIYVKSFEFKAPGAYTDADIESIRKQVAGPGWSRMVSVRDKNELTEIYVWRERDTTGGLAILTAEPNELTVVNIVGRVDLASLAALGPMIPHLPKAIGKAKAK